MSMRASLLFLAAMACDGGDLDKVDPKDDPVDDPNTPSIRFVEPDGSDDVASATYTIVWADDDADDDAKISLFYDPEDPRNGELIVEDLSEDDETDSFDWDVSGVDEGEYFLYAIIDDGKTATTAYSEFPVLVDRSEAVSPGITLESPDGDTADDSFEITWIDADPDSDATIALFYDTDASGEDGVEITSGISEDDTDDAYVWDTSGMAEGEYWVYAVIDDGLATFTDYSPGSLTISHGPPNVPPTIAVVQPDGNDTADASFTITWNDDDPDDNATVQLFWDDDAVGANGTLIATVDEDDTADAFVWDTSALPEGDYWVYATIDDGQAAAIDYSAGPVAIAHPGAGCDPVADGSTVTVDVPTSLITIDVFLDGQPITSANTNDDDEGKILLVDPETGLVSLGLLDVWDDANDQSNYPLTVGIVAGTYDIYYQNINPGTSWPLNTFALIDQGVDLSTDGNLLVDVPSAAVTVDMTLGGAAVSAGNSSGTDEGGLFFTDGADDRIELAPAWDETLGQPQGPWTLTVIPGIYEARYQIWDAGPNWPRNTDAYLQDVDFIAPTSVTVDVPVVSQSIDLLLDGTALSAANSGDLDEGQLRLRSSANVDDSFVTGGVWDDDADAILTPFSLPVIPGAYAVEYEVVNAGPNWPGNTSMSLTSTTFTGSPFTLDIATSAIELDLTLDGVVVSAANSGDFDEGQIVLYDPVSGSVSYEVTPVWDDTNEVPNTPYDLVLVAGTYDVHYNGFEPGANWPANTNATIRDGVDLSFDQSVSFDVPVVDITLDMTLDGAALSAANTGDDDEGRLVLRNGEDSLPLIDVWDDAADAVQIPWVFRTVPAVYQVHYESINDGPNWPGGLDRSVTAVDLTSDRVVTVDLPVTGFSIDVTLNGAAAAGTLNDFDEGALQLYGPDGDVIPMVGGMWDDPTDTSNLPWDLELVPGGVYDVEFVSLDAGAWPLNESWALGCLDVQ